MPTRAGACFLCVCHVVAAAKAAAAEDSMDATKAAVAAVVAVRPATVEQCKVLQQVIKLLEHTDEAKTMLPLAKMTPEMLQTTLQVQHYKPQPPAPA